MAKQEQGMELTERMVNQALSATPPNFDRAERALAQRTTILARLWITWLSCLAASESGSSLESRSTSWRAIARSFA